MKKRALCLLTVLLLFVLGAPLNSQDMSLENFDGQQIVVAKAAKKEKASKKQKNKKGKDESATIEEQQPDETEGLPITKIFIDSEKRKKSGYFSGIDSECLTLFENGSAESIVEALAKMKKPFAEYQENERVLVYIATEIMKVVWPSQNASLEYPPVETRNAYIGAIESARSGLYDTSTGNSDFFACVLPSLILCNQNSRADYYERAEADLKASLELCPKSVLANYLLALLYCKTGKNSAALSCLKICAETSAVFEINFQTAFVLNELGRYDECQTITDRLLIMYPSDLRLLKLIAKVSYNRADYSSAERYAMLILTQNPADLEAVLFRAKVFVRTGEYLKAASLLDVYAKSNPNGRDYLVLRARVQKEWNKNLSAAITSIEKALSLFPGDTEVVLYAAELAGASGRTVGGKTGAELSEQILVSDPENPAALSFLIQTLVDSEQWRKAYDSSKKLLAKDSSSTSISTHVSICLALGYNEEAWNNASSLYEKSPSEERAVQTYVDAMVRTGKTAQALRFINSSISSASSSMKSFLYYQRSFLSGVEATQLADLRSSIMANPRNSDALFRMYRIYFQKQDYRKAQYYLRQVIALNPNNANYLRLNADLDKLIK